MISDPQTSLYFRSSHDLSPGINSIKLVSEKPPGHCKFISFASKVDNLNIENLIQNPDEPTEFSATAENKS